MANSENIDMNNSDYTESLVSIESEDCFANKELDKYLESESPLTTIPDRNTESDAFRRRRSERLSSRRIDALVEENESLRSYVTTTSILMEMEQAKNERARLEQENQDLKRQNEELVRILKGKIINHFQPLKLFKVCTVICISCLVGLNFTNLVGRNRK